MIRPQRSPLAAHWGLDEDVVFLNHGSFGATPTPVLLAQTELRRRMEAEPVLFLHRQLEERLDGAREALAAFVGAAADDIVFVPNATTGVNTVLRSLDFAPGDRIVVTDLEYNATRNAVDFTAARSGAEVVVAGVPFPLRSADEVVEAVLRHVDSATRLCVIDHVTSQTGMVLPVERLVDELARRGVDTLVDGAHGPGMLDLRIDALGAAFYTGNCHKWVSAPKGAAFLHVRRDRQHRVRPLVISHGANSTRRDRSRFHVEGDWTGTCDPTAWLAIPAALEFFASVVPGGWPEVRAHNRRLVLEGRRMLCEVLGIPSPCPDDMIGSLASVPLSDGEPGDPPLHLDPLQRRLFDEHRIEVPVMPWPRAPRRLLRISAQLYNAVGEYRYLADVLPDAVRGGPSVTADRSRSKL